MYYVLSRNKKTHTNRKAHPNLDPEKYTKIYLKTAMFSI